MFGFPPLKRPFHKTHSDASAGRPTRSVTLPSGRTYRMSVVREPDIDICRDCGEHAEFEETDDGCVSNCCGAGSYCPDEYEANDER